MNIRTIEDLDKVLEDRKKEGFNHPPFFLKSISTNNY